MRRITDSFRALATINATGGGTLEPVQGSRVLTCFTDRSKHKNCIQVVQAELNGVYGGALNQSLEFRFIYTYNKVRDLLTAVRSSIYFFFSNVVFKRSIDIYCICLFVNHVYCFIFFANCN